MLGLPRPSMAHVLGNTLVKLPVPTDDEQVEVGSRAAEARNDCDDMSHRETARGLARTLVMAKHWVIVLLILVGFFCAMVVAAWFERRNSK